MITTAAHEPGFAKAPKGEYSTQLKHIVCASVSRSFALVTAENVLLVPLTFVKDSHERRWNAHVHSPWRWRVIMYACVYLLFLLLAALSTEYIADVSVSSAARTLNNASYVWIKLTTFGIAGFLAMSLLLIGWYGWNFGRNVDTITYIYFYTHYICALPSLWLIVWSETDISSLKAQYPEAPNVMTIIALDALIHNLIFVASIVLVPWVTLNLFFQTKIKLSWPLLMLCLIIIIGHFSLLAAKLRLLGYCYTVCVHNVMIVVCIYLMRYHRELQERMEFLKLLQAQRRMAVLHQEVIRLSSDTGDGNIHGESTLEEMLSLLKESKNLLTIVNSKIHSPEALRAMEIVKEVVTTMSIGGDLFKVRFANLGEEGETIINQYIRGRCKPQSALVNLQSRDDSCTEMNELQKDTKQARQVAMNTKRMRNSSGIDRNITSGHVPDVIAGVPSIDLKDIAFAEMDEKVGYEWDLDVFDFAAHKPDILVQFGAALLMPYCNFLGIPVHGLLGFLCSLQECYWDNAYHNRIHASFVAHATNCFANMLGLHAGSVYSELTEIIYITASLGHDVGHPSRNNQFFVNTYDPLAVIYNDVSVLENYHAFLTFQILDNGPCDIFGQLTVSIYREARKRIIEVILATDMKEHFESISKFRIRRSAAGFQYRDDIEDMWHCIRIIVKAADLSHACVPWDQHFLWSCLIQEEFYQQGEEEISLGQPLSPLCDRDSHPFFAKSQKGFLEFVVAPLFTELREIDPNSEVNKLLENLWGNKERWSRFEASGELVAFPEHVVRYQEKRRAELRAGGGVKALWLYVNRLNSEQRGEESADYQTTRLNSASRTFSIDPPLGGTPLMRQLRLESKASTPSLRTAKSSAKREGGSAGIARAVRWDLESEHRSK